MKRESELGFPGYRTPRSSAVRPLRDRSRSPKRSRIDPGRSSDTRGCEPVRNDGRRRRSKASRPTENEYRDRSPNHPYDAKAEAKHLQFEDKKYSQKSVTKTKGLSNRIHSLRRLLEKATDMPAVVRQEKERELQGYMADQQRRKAKREKNAVTSRYHFVRFLERKKAERKLKQLEQSSDRILTDGASIQTHNTTSGPRHGRGGDDAEANVNAGGNPQSSSPIETLPSQQKAYKRLLHEAKVDLNYTVYAPLDQKYISLYASSSKRGKPRIDKGGGKAEPDHAAVVDDDEAGIFRNDCGQKPPMWYKVEKAMVDDSLEALRDGKIMQAGQQGGQTLRSRNTAEPVNGKRNHGSLKKFGGEEEVSEDEFFER